MGRRKMWPTVWLILDENEQAGLCACSGVVAQAIKSAQIVTYAAHEKYEFPLAYAEYERVQNNIYGEPTVACGCKFYRSVDGHVDRASS